MSFVLSTGENNLLSGNTSRSFWRYNDTIRDIGDMYVNINAKIIYNK